MGRWIVAPAGNCRLVLRADTRAATARQIEHVVALTRTGAGDPARKYRSKVIGPTSYLWRTGVMRLVYWFVDAYESLVSLIQIGMEG